MTAPKPVSSGSSCTDGYYKFGDNNLYRIWRLYTLTAIPSFALATMGSPVAGGRVDGCSSGIGRGTISGDPATSIGIWAIPGKMFFVESGGSFSVDDLLEVTGTGGNAGRVIERTSGRIVARALQASTGAGQTILAVFTTP